MTDRAPTQQCSSTVGLILFLWQAPLVVCSAKHRHQSPEWTILSHVNYFIEGEIIGFQILLVVSFVSQRKKLLRSSWHLFRLAFVQCGWTGIKRGHNNLTATIRSWLTGHTVWMVDRHRHKPGGWVYIPHRKLSLKTKMVEFMFRLEKTLKMIGKGFYRAVSNSLLQHKYEGNTNEWIISQNAEILKFYFLTISGNLRNLWRHHMAKFRWRWP